MAAGTVGGIAKLIRELLEKILSRGGGGGGGALMVRSPSTTPISAYGTATGNLNQATPSRSPVGEGALASASSTSSTSSSPRPRPNARRSSSSPISARSSSSRNNNNGRQGVTWWQGQWWGRSNNAQSSSSSNNNQVHDDPTHHKFHKRRSVTPRRSRSPQPGPSSPPRRPSSSQEYTRFPTPFSTPFSTPFPAQIGGGFGRLQIRGNGGGLQQGRGGPSVPASSQVALAAVVLNILGKTGAAAGKTALAVLQKLPAIRREQLRSVMQFVGVGRTAAVVANILKQPFHLVFVALTKIFSSRKTKLKMN